jgi:hypothetical protein
MNQDVQSRRPRLQNAAGAAVLQDFRKGLWFSRFKEKMCPGTIKAGKEARPAKLFMVLQEPQAHGRLP